MENKELIEMKQEIWKYSFSWEPGVEDISMPHNAQIISVGIQNNEPVMWAIVDIEAIKYPRRMYKHMTGRVLYGETNVTSFLGTLQHPIHPYVIHIFVYKGD